MQRKKAYLVLCLMLLILFAVSAHADALMFVNPPTSIAPGKLTSITFSVDQDKPVNLELRSLDNALVAQIVQDYAASSGENLVVWDGTYFNQSVLEGDYLLVLQSGNQDVSTNVTITAPLPMFTQVMLSDFEVRPGIPFSITLATNMEAKLAFSLIDGDQVYALGEGTVSPTPATIQWDGRVKGELLKAGKYTMELVLSDIKTGEVAVTEHYDIDVYNEEAAAIIATAPDIEPETKPETEPETETEIEPDPEPMVVQSAVFTPAYPGTHQCDHANCYWNTPMDITDEKAVWDMLMAPMMIVDGNEKKQIKLMSEPDEESTPIADITCASQSVHVLENLDNGWSLVETYSSSFHDSKIKAWNAFETGYVKTKQLKEKAPGNKEFGIVIDKLTQRLYLFQNGSLLAELYCSTGLANERQPYNETRSGEFFLISAVGEFKSDNLRCSFGIRFNDGDLLHEVPHTVNGDGTYNYKNTEPKLGLRASHGCIRVQRLLSPDGINMKWIWNNIYRGISSKTVKIAIWEDFAGRQLPIPDGDTLLYYNPSGGTSYHKGDSCTGIKEKFLPLASFHYSELDTDAYKSLNACGACVPLRRLSEINEINEAHQIQ